MIRLAAALVLALVPASAARAEDDGWTGQWIFPKVSGVALRNEDCKELMKWTTSAKVTWAGKEWVTIRHSEGSGPFEGYVMKSEVVKLADAPGYFTDKIQADEKDRWAWISRGYAWSLKGEHDNAIKDITEAIRLKPDSWAYIFRGLALCAKKDYDKAIKDYDEAIRLDPKYAIAFSNRGNAWSDKNDYDKAIKDFDEAIRLDPKHADAFNNRGDAWSRKKDYDKAIKDLDEAIRLDPKHAIAFYNKACCYSHLGKPDFAIENLGKSLELGWDDFKYLEGDTNLDSIRDDPRYKKLLAKYKK